jgi:hypothetical protein
VIDKEEETPMRAVRTLALTVVAVATLVAPLGGIAAAGQGNGGSGGGSGGGKAEVLATLKIDNPNVEVKQKGADDFEPATDDQKLRQGDTVRTDATGKAEIDYSGGSYTRLDVNTTFKIVKLTEDQGQRQVEGGLESGRTWNRAEDVTESGSFEQSGGGATAAVTGTAFAVECTSLSDCTYQAIVDVTDLTGKDGEKRTLTPLTECDSDDGALCDEVSDLTPEEIAANAWIQENLLRDLLERGYGPGPFVIGGTLIIQDGVITFEESPAPTPPPPSSTTTTTTVPAPPPALADPPLLCESDYTSSTTLPGASECAYGNDVNLLEFEPTSEIIVNEGDEVLFRANVITNGATEPVSIVFDHVPDGSDSEDPFYDTGDYCVGEETGEGGCIEYLQEDTEYPADTIFRFIASYSEECSSCTVAVGTLVFHLTGPSGTSAPASVDVTVCAWNGCGIGEEGFGQAITAALNTPPAPRSSDTPSTTTPTTSAPTTTAPASTTTTSVAPDQ